MREGGGGLRCGRPPWRSAGKAKLLLRGFACGRRLDENACACVCASVRNFVVAPGNGFLEAAVGEKGGGEGNESERASERGYITTGEAFVTACFDFVSLTLKIRSL